MVKADVPFSSQHKVADRRVQIGLFVILGNANGRFETQYVGKRPKPRDLTFAGRRDHGRMTESFSGVDVGKVDLNDREANSADSISQSDAGVGIGRGVENDCVKLALGLLNPTDQLPLHIGLSELDFDLQCIGPFSHQGFEVSQSGAAIHFRFALAEQVQVWTV